MSVPKNGTKIFGTEKIPNNLSHVNVKNCLKVVQPGRFVTFTMSIATSHRIIAP